MRHLRRTLWVVLAGIPLLFIACVGLVAALFDCWPLEVECRRWFDAIWNPRRKP